jgi:hypothetical protein
MGGTGAPVPEGAHRPPLDMGVSPSYDVSVHM